MHKCQLEVRKFDEGLWSYHFLIPQKIVDALTQDGKKRVMCKVGDNQAFHAGFMPDGNSNWFVKLNKERMKYGMHMPEELEELLFQDPEWEKFFETLTDGKKRSLIYLVAKPKSSDIRLRKALIILQHLKLNKGKLDFKALNEALKGNQDLDSFFR
jgi:hypothetical protein